MFIGTGALALGYVFNVLGWTALTYAWLEANEIFLESCLDALIRNVRNANRS